MTTQRTCIFEITGEEIDTLVTAFYARIREHQILGPIFLSAVGHGDQAWTEHEQKISRFWKNAILKEQCYSGNPMQKHLANQDIAVEHFALWLDLFEEVAYQTLPSATSARFAVLARRIGKGLSFGIENFRRGSASPPVLN